MAADTRSLITTRPACVPCPRCGRLQLTGHAEGVAYRVDPLPLTTHAELAARQSDRSSYALIADGLAYRDATRITGDRHGRPPVLVSHVCEHPPAAEGVDATQVATLARLVTRAQQRKTEHEPAPITDVEFDAVALMVHGLGARVLAADFDAADPEPPPF